MAFASAAAIVGAAALSFAGGESANASRRREAGNQMAFQERMSGTAYQRAMEDMRQSGLNPILAYQRGGATTPSGAMGAVQDTVTPAISAGASAYQTTQQGKLTNASTKNMEQNTKKAREDTAQAAALAGKTTAEAQIQTNEAYKSQLEREMLNSALGRKIFEAGKGASWITKNLPSLGLGRITSPSRARKPRGRKTR